MKKIIKELVGDFADQVYGYAYNSVFDEVLKEVEKYRPYVYEFETHNGIDFLKRIDGGTKCYITNQVIEVYNRYQVIKRRSNIQAEKCKRNALGLCVECGSEPTVMVGFSHRCQNCKDK